MEFISKVTADKYCYLHQKTNIPGLCYNGESKDVYGQT